jgi:plastocyanin
MKRRITAALAACVLLAAAQPGAAQEATPATATIEIKDFDFHPMNVTVAAGGSVTWKNHDGEPHTVTSTDGLFRSGAIDQEDSFTYKFDRPGVYGYLCSIHPKMRATVTVK